ncbi:TetR family transcriptional regulator [Carbonactinospora thermoautotrophica]|uniref:TetR family transcriptional regulator n=3 Tax=Carbonactinospora thermoautotrophica TaxID=1469144 RepID=A0A132N0E5_9ACTN|nr:TetR family transcriptional regulator [Carbonactinospora thermoautotrophica]KWX03390.1 TetR family transcriptional regulator [Carbonactinospora thermoautotrophica]
MTGLRELKKLRTRRAIQEQALRLFLEKGYAATTVEEIAAAAEVSPATFFRYFPTKEDVVLSDEYDPLIERLLAERPADEPPVQRVRRALAAGFAQVYAADRDRLLARVRLILDTPALRARLWENQLATQELLRRALGGREDTVEEALRTRLIAAGCVTAVVTALITWVETGGTADLPDLVDRALATLEAGFQDT